MKNRNRVGACPRTTLRTVAVVAAAIGAFGVSGVAYGFAIDSGSPDVNIRLDNTFKFNAAMRLRDQDPWLANTYGNQSSEYATGKGDIYTARFDLLNEFDVHYKNENGLRITTALWADPKFRSEQAYSSTLPGGAQTRSGGPNGQWSSEVKRYYEGPSGEVLDAFLFGKIDLSDETSISVKAGRTSIVWGESFIGRVGGLNTIGFAQNPDDGRKSSSSPGASLKETVLPISQIHAIVSLPDDVNLSVYANTEWRGSRDPAGGTYLGFNDGLGNGINNFPLYFNGTNGVIIPRAESLHGKGRDWGVQVKMRPDWLDGSMFVAYRKFDDKSADWYATFAADGSSYRDIYANDVKILGIGINKTVWETSFSMELNYRKDAALVSDFSSVNPLVLQGLGKTPTDGARGDTLHLLFNGVKLTGSTPLWDLFTWVGEVGYTHLAKVTRNEQFLEAEGTGRGWTCNVFPQADKKVAGCIDKDSIQLGLSLTPTWYQALAGMDLEAPMYFNYNWGNQATAGGASDGGATISVGLRATYKNTHKFSLNYLAFKEKVNHNNTAGSQVNGAPYYDRDQIQATYEYHF